MNMIKNTICLIFISIVIAIFFWPILFRPSTFLSDGQFSSYYQAVDLWSELWAGGWPILADSTSMATYPIRLLFLFLGLSFDSFIYSAYLIGALGSFLYLRSIQCNHIASTIGAISFSLSGWMLAHLGHTSMIHASIWLPWMILSIEMISAINIEKKHIWFVVLAVSIALSILAGHMQITIYSLLLVIAYTSYQAITKQSWLILLVCISSIGLGVILCSFNLIPTLELVSYTPRSNLTPESIFQYSLPPSQAFDLIIPFLHGVSSLSNLGIPFFGKWNVAETTGFFPHIIMLAAIIGMASWPKNRLLYFWLGVCVFGILLALGNWFILGKWFTYLVPSLNKFRAPSRHLLEFSFAFSILASMGIHALLEGLVQIKTRKGIFLFSTLLFLSVLSMIYICYQPMLKQQAAASGLSLAEFWCYPPILWSFVSFILSLPIIFLVFNKFKKIKISALVGIFIFQVSIYGYQLEWRTHATPSSYLEEPRWAFHYRNLTGINYRVLGIDGYANAIFHPDLSRLHHLPTIGWYGPLILKAFSEVTGVTSSGWTRRESFYTDNKSMDIFSVKYIAVKEKDRPLFDAQVGRWNEVEKNEGTIIYENMRAIPRSWVVNRLEKIRRDQILLAILTGQLPDGRGFDPLKVALVEDSIGFINGFSDDNKFRTQIVKNDSSSMIIDVWSSLPGVLVISDVFYPGWKSYVNGIKTPISQVNYILRGVIVPQGNSRVELYFLPESFIWGILLSASAFFTLTIILIWKKMFNLLFGSSLLSINKN